MVAREERREHRFDRDEHDRPTDALGRRVILPRAEHLDVRANRGDGLDEQRFAVGLRLRGDRLLVPREGDLRVDRDDEVARNAQDDVGTTGRIRAESGELRIEADVLRHARELEQALEFEFAPRPARLRVPEHALDAFGRVVDAGHLRVESFEQRRDARLVLRSDRTEIGQRFSEDVDPFVERGDLGDESLAERVGIARETLRRRFHEHLARFVDVRRRHALQALLDVAFAELHLLDPFHRAREPAPDVGRSRRARVELRDELGFGGSEFDDAAEGVFRVGAGRGGLGTFGGELRTRAPERGLERASRPATRCDRERPRRTGRQDDSDEKRDDGDDRFQDGGVHGEPLRSNESGMGAARSFGSMRGDCAIWLAQSERRLRASDARPSARRSGSRRGDRRQASPRPSADDIEPPKTIDSHVSNG